MIIDRLEEANQYCRLHPGFDAAFDLLRSTPSTKSAPGRHEVMGDSLVLIIDHVEGKGREAARLEAHRKYIDVQLLSPAKGAVVEEFGWRPTAACSQTTAKYDAAKDIVFFGDQPEIWFAVPPGYFVVFFPSDAHAPLAGSRRDPQSGRESGGRVVMPGVRDQVSGISILVRDKTRLLTPDS